MADEAINRALDGTLILPAFWSQKSFTPGNIPRGLVSVHLHDPAQAVSSRQVPI
jgi:hypothetical protein